MRRGLAIAVTAAACVVATAAVAQIVAREQDIDEVRLGQRILVDDGSCPSGQIKEVSGTKLTASGVTRVVKCVPRPGGRR